jgi:hypothetical protein
LIFEQTHWIKRKTKKVKIYKSKRIIKAEFEEIVKKEMKISLIKAIDY